MPKKSNESQMNLYHVNYGQAEELNEEKLKKKKAKEREKRIKENKQRNKEMQFDLETETVIQMTNKNKIKKEEQIREELNKKERKREKRNKKIKFFLKLFLFVGLILGATIFALTSPIFNIKNINVINNSNVPTDTIISLSELKTEENIFKFYAGSVANKIKENPYIEEITIHRRLPNTVEIDVKEREIKYSVDYMSKYAYIDKQGYIVEISEDNKGMTIIQGITTKEEEATVGNRLCNEDLNRLQDVIKIINSANENGLEGKITSIDISNKNEYSMYLGEEKKKVHLGDTTNLSNKMLYIIAIIEQEKGKEGDIYINGNLNDKFKPYFREKV